MKHSMDNPTPAPGAVRRGGMLVLVFLLVGIGTPAYAGSAGAEVRAYPAGLIPSLRGELGSGARGIVLGQIGYNVTDRRDWGAHQDESGSGLGVGAGWLHPVTGRWIAGVRVDYWWLEIDWKDPGRAGSTEVGVLQPTAVAGYRWPVGAWDLEATLALGGEFNLQTDGENVGEGWILLVGFGGFFRF